MQIACHKKKDTLVVEMEGELDHHTANAVRDRLDSILDDASIKNMVIDLKKLKFMDSSGIGVFIGRYKNIAQRGGIIAVAQVTPQIHKILEVSGLYRILRKYISVQEALTDLGGAINNEYY